MTVFDFAVLGIVGVSFLLGIGRGVISEILAVVSWFLAFWAAKALHDPLAGLLNVWMNDPALRKAVAMIAIVLVVLLAGTIARILITKLVSVVGLGMVDRLLGGVFGFARGVLVSMVLVMLGGMTGLPKLPWWRQAVLSPPLETLAIATKGYLPRDLSARILFH